MNVDWIMRRAPYIILALIIIAVIIFALGAGAMGFSPLF